MQLWAARRTKACGLSSEAKGRSGGSLTRVILTKSRKSGEAFVSSANTGGGPLTMHIITCTYAFAW